MRAPFADAGADHAPAGPARPDSRTGEGTVNLAGLLRLRGFARVNRKIEVKSKALAKPRARRPESNSRISGSGHSHQFYGTCERAGLPPVADTVARQPSANDRDRGESRDAAPPTPPYVRVRIRRFEKLR